MKPNKLEKIEKETGPKPQAQFLGWKIGLDKEALSPFYKIKGAHDLAGQEVDLTTLIEENLDIPSTPSFQEWFRRAVANNQSVWNFSFLLNDQGHLLTRFFFLFLLGFILTGCVSPPGLLRLLP